MPSPSRPDDSTELKHRAIELARAGKTAEAAALLRSLVQSKAPIEPQLREWATAQLQRLEPARKSVDVASLYSAADDLFGKYDYEQAAALLQSIPSAQHTADSRKLMKTAVGLRDEVAELVADLQANLSTGHFDRLEADVGRLLEICPVSTVGKRLRAALDTYRRIPKERRRYRVSDSGELLAADTSGSSRAFVVVALMAVVVAAWGGWQNFRDRRVEVAIRFDQPPAAGVPLRIQIDGQMIDMTVDGATLTLPPGDYVYEIYAASTRLLGPVRISVQAGLPNVVTVAVADLHLDTQIAAAGGVPVLPAVPGIANSPANDAPRPGVGPPVPMNEPAGKPVVAAPPAASDPAAPGTPMPAAGASPAPEKEAEKPAPSEVAAAPPRKMEAAPLWEPAIDEAMKPFTALGGYFFRNTDFRSNAIFFGPPQLIEDRKKALEMLADASWVEGLAWPNEEITAEEVALVRRSGITRLRIDKRHVALLDNPELRTVDVTLMSNDNAGILSPIGKLAKLEELRINDHGRKFVNPTFLNSLPNPGKLKHLDCHVQNADRSSPLYGTVVSKFTGLEVLVLYMSSRGEAKVRMTMPTLPNLRRLSLTDVTVARTSFRNLAKSPELEELKLSESGLTDAEMPSFAGLTKLEVLSLYNEKVADEGLDPLSKIENLTEVSLVNLPIRGPGLRFLNSHPNLNPKRIRLHCRALADDELQIFSRLPQIDTVSVAGTAVTSKGIASLIAMPHVKFVDCLSNQISRDEAVALTQGTSKRIRFQD